MAKKLLTLLIILALLLGALSLLSLAEGNTGAVPEADPPVQREFPSLHITSALHPFRQAREFWHTGTLTLESDNESWAFEDVDVRLRGRGNSTWLNAPDKRPLRIRFEEPQPMFGSAYPHRDWILLANAFDNSLLRTHFAFYLSERMGRMGFVPSSQFLHLYINGEYKGVYQLTDERDIGPGRGEVVIDADPAVSEYWLEMDWRTQDYFQVNGLWYDIRFPSGNALTDGHIAYAYQFIENVSLAIRSHNWQDIQALVDIPSMLDYYILQELVKDMDVNASSMFMQIRGQGENRRLYQGPVWDFDLSLGNARSPWFIGDNPENISAARLHYWFRELVRVPEFRDLVIERWSELMEDEIPSAIESVRYMLATYRSAFERNFEAQPVLGVRWGGSPAPHRYEITTWVGHVEWLLQFIQDRVAWLDAFYNSEAFSELNFFFDDVFMGTWYREAVEFVFSQDLMFGMSATVFAPHGTLSRAMAAAILWRLAGEPEAEWSPVFTDIPENAQDWYRTAVMWAEETGVVRGYGDQFNPYGNITREQMAAMLYRYTRLILEAETDVPEEFNLDRFEDADEISDWAKAYLFWANYMELIRGIDSSTLDPLGLVTRAQCAAMLMRYVQTIVEHETRLVRNR